MPLLQGLGIGIALMSYAGTVCWGFNSDPDLVPDVEVFVDQVRRALERVRKAAGVLPAQKPFEVPVAPSTGTSTASLQ